MSISQLQALLASLEAELQALEAQASGSAPAVTSFTFTRDLQLWDRGTDVMALQEFLIQENTGHAAQALGRHGVTRTFGLLTYNALVEFQTSVGITPAKGYFGAKTRAWVNTH
jgi:peptidoglycan hydrolase-like protein with peptidoglycan-binding domain